MLTLAVRPDPTPRPTTRPAPGLWNLVEVAVADPKVGTLRIDLTDQAAPVPCLPFEVAWWFPPTGHLAWQAVGAAFGLRVLTGWITEAHGRLRHGCWITDCDRTRANALALLADQPVLVEWTAHAVTVVTADLLDAEPVVLSRQVWR